MPVMATKGKATTGGNVKGKAKAAPQSQADRLEERVKRVRAKAADRQAKDAADIEKLEAAAEAEKAKQAAKAEAEAAKAAEAARQAEVLAEASKGVALVVGAESAGLVNTVAAAWRLGDAIVAAKRAHAAVSPGDLDVVLGWTLLGDPALVVGP